VSIGLGGIVHDAHYPAYQIAGFEVAGGFDLDAERAAEMKAKFDIPVIYESLAQAVEQAPDGAVFDVAVPGGAITDVLPHLPDGSAVLIQKPMGENLDQAREILVLCHEKNLTAAMNFQMRYAPYIIAARDMIDSGAIGEIYDMEVRIQVNTPWHLWKFLFELPRVEILYHSIHYIDLVRSFLGDPQGIYAKTLNHPIAEGLHGGTRSMMILDYGDNPRVNIMTNHSHAYSAQKHQSYVKWEGSKGAIQVRAGLNMNYPHGVPDHFEYILNGDGEAWQQIDINGSWFPEAFIGTMASVMRKATGETDDLPTAVDDAFKTMAVVEAAYTSSETGGTPIPEA
jgi:predicted dehydrogenase